MQDSLRQFSGLNDSLKITMQLDLQTTQWSELDMHCLLGLDCMAFDWHTMKSYDPHDFSFDFSKPGAFRWLHPNFEGFFSALPSRTGVLNAGDGPGIEVCCGLE